MHSDAHLNGSLQVGHIIVVLVKLVKLVQVVVLVVIRIGLDTFPVLRARLTRRVVGSIREKEKVVLQLILLGNVCRI